jgi:tetratricopeptide (TPR) repeat protein
MRTHLIRGVLAMAVVMIVAAPVAAQNIIRGKVVDAKGQPVEGATVLFEGLEGFQRKMETKTNRQGEFLQVGLPSGPYNVTASKDNLKQTLKATISGRAPADLQFTLAPGSGVSPEEAKELAAMQELAKSAVDALNAGRTDEAIKSFNDIIAKVPTCSDCYYNLGVAYQKTQRLAEAEAAYKKVTELRPDSADAWTGLATVYNQQKRFDLATEASNQAAKLASSAPGGASAETTYNQGVILWNAGKYAEAKAQFEAAIKADPNMAMAHYQLGMANLNLGLIPDARAAFNGYLKAAPNGDKAAEVQMFLKQLPQ